MNLSLKKEANQLLYEFNLYETLLKYTKKENIHISGSYELELMVWRDLDIFIDIEGISQDDMYDLTSKVMYQFRPVWVETKDTHNENTGCPKGYFLGFETLKVNNELWNVDIWVTNREYINSNIEYTNKVKNSLDDNLRKIIMDIKRELIKSGEYGSKYYSVDIYDAVLKKEVRTLKDLIG